MKPKKLSDKRMYAVLKEIYRDAFGRAVSCRGNYRQAKELSRFGLIVEVGFGCFKSIDSPEIEAHVEKLLTEFEKQNNF